IWKSSCSAALFWAQVGLAKPIVIATKIRMRRIAISSRRLNPDHIVDPPIQNHHWVSWVMESYPRNAVSKCVADYGSSMHVGSWHRRDVPRGSLKFRLWWPSGHAADGIRGPVLTRSGPRRFKTPAWRLKGRDFRSREISGRALDSPE